MLEAVKRLCPSEIQEAKDLFDVDDESNITIHEFYTYKLITNGEIRELVDGNPKGGRYIREFAADLITKSARGQNLK